MSKKDEALKLALEALEVATTPLAEDRQEVLRARAAIREALAEQPAQGCEFYSHPLYAGTKCKNCGREQPAQQQEPVAVVSGYYGGQCVILPTNPARLFNSGTALYTSPPASKPWVGLTQKDIDIAFDDTQEGGGFDEFARAIEAKLKERNA